MLKKIAVASIGLTFIVSPLLVSAQATSSNQNAGLIASLTQLVKILTAELQQLIATRGMSLTPPSNNATTQTGTIDQSGTTLSLASNTQITGVSPAGYSIVQLWIVPTSYTGKTDWYTLFHATRGYDDYNPNISYTGTTVDASGHWSTPLSNVVGESQSTGSFTLLLFGIPANDPVGPYKDSGFTIAPTLIAKGTLNVTSDTANTTAATATIDPSSLVSVTDHPIVTGTATHTGTVRVLFGDGYYGNVTTPVVGGRWSVSRTNIPDQQPGMLITVFDSNNTVLTSGRLVVQSSVINPTVQSNDIHVGTGALAAPGSTVSVTYVGKLIDGTIFDSTASHGNVPLTFQLGGTSVIPGFSAGIQGMRVGGERIMIIPPSLGYGTQGVKNPDGTFAIPANATLSFDVTLTSVQ